MAVIKEEGKYKIKGKIKRDDGTYYNYKKVVPSAKRLSDAKAYEVDFLRKFQEEQRSYGNKTFKELVELYKLEPKENKTSTINTDNDIFEKVIKIIGDKKINLITKEYLQKYIRDLEAKYSYEYVKKYYYTINKIFEYAVDHDYLNYNPLRKVKRSKNKDEVKKEMLFWEPNQFKQFISVVDDIQLNVLFSFLFYMGTRKGETVALQWRDIDFKNNTVKINKTVTIKTKDRYWALTAPKTKNSIRNISMPLIINNALIELKQAHIAYPGFNENCFIFGFNRPSSYETLRRKFNFYIDKANRNIDGKPLPQEKQIPIIRIHDLRHSHASYLLNNMSAGFTDFDVAKRLGDTVQTLHSTYAHWFKQADKSIINFIDNDIK